MNSFHERIRSHGYAVKSHVKKHHKKYLGGFFAGFAVVKMILLLLGFFGFYNMGTSADFIGTTYNYQDITDYPSLNGGFIGKDFWQNWESNSGDVGNIMNIFYDDNENNFYRQNWDRDRVNCDLNNMQMVVVTGRDNGLCDSEGCDMMVSQMNNGDENIVYLLAGDGDALDFEQLSITNVPNCVSILGVNIDSIGNNSTPQVKILLSADGLILSGNNVLEGLDMIGGPVSVPDDVKNITLHNINLRGSDTDGLQILGSHVSLDTANVYGNENGIVISGNASYNIVNNVQIWGNGKGFILSDNENYNAINNSQIYNNEYGIYSVSDLQSDDLSMIFNNLDVYNNQYGLYLGYVGGDRYLNDIDMYNNDVDIDNVQDLKCCGVLSLETGSDTDMCDESFLECSNIYENFENFGGEYNYLDVSWDYITNPYNEGSGFMYPWVAIGDDMIGRSSMDDVLYYSYGNGLKLQHQPLAWSGTDIVAMGVFDAGYYIGSNIERVGGSLEVGDISDTGYVMITGNTTDTGVSNYSVFGDIVDNIIGETIGNTTGINLSGGYGPKILVTQLFEDNQSAMHFEIDVDYVENEYIEEYTITYHDLNSEGYDDVVFTGSAGSETTNVEIPSWTRDGYILTRDTETPEIYPTGNMVINAVWIVFDIDIVGSDKTCATEQILSATTSVTGAEMMVVSGLPGSSCDEDVFIGKGVAYTPGSNLTFNKETDNEKYVCFKASSGGVSVYSGVQVVGIDTEGPDVQIIWPRDGGSLTSRTVDFEWYGDYKGCADISGYLLELSGGDLDGVFSLELGPDASIYTTGLEDGSYEWRLVATDTNGNSSDGKWQSFSVKFSEPKSNGTWNGQDSCLSGRDNDKFLDDEFWSGWNNLTDSETKSGAIICALYGSGEGDTTAYTSGWNNWQRGTSCNVSEMNVQFVTQIIDMLNENTVYVLNTGEIELPPSSNGLYFGKCSAVVSSGGTVFYTQEKTSRTCYFNDRQYGIIDNISVDGSKGHDDLNNYGIYVNSGGNNTIHRFETTHNSQIGVYLINSKYNTLNGVQSHNNSGTGICLGSSSNNSFDNIQSYSNSGHGIELSNSSGNKIKNTQIYNNNDGVYLLWNNEKNIFNNIQSYNNNGYGFYLRKENKNNVFNNIQVYNNNSHGFYLSVPVDQISAWRPNESNVLNGIQSYNNNGHGIIIGTGYSGYGNNRQNSNNILHTILSYNNSGYGLLNKGQNNKIYGFLYLFENINNSNDVAGGDDGYFLEILRWTYYNDYVYSANMSFDFITNPMDESGNYLLDWSKTGSDLRGKKTIGKVVGYSYGSGILTQIQPVLYSGSTVVTGGDYDSTKYIGSDVEKITGDLETPEQVTRFMTVTGCSNQASIYSIFGNIGSSVTGNIGDPVLISLVGAGKYKKIITQLSDEDYFATHFEKTLIVTGACLSGRDNDHFLTPEFWKQNPLDSEIACALYGSGGEDQTAYTMGWNGYTAGNTCGRFDEMTVVRTDTLPPTLAENTIYVLTTTGTQVTGTVDIPNCTAIVSSMIDGYDTVFYSDTVLSTPMISLQGRYGILDNVSVDGINNLGSYHSRNNNVGILLSGAESNTFNVVKVYNNTGDGIKVLNSQFNLLNNIQTYNNKGVGIDVVGSQKNSLDNVQSQRNNMGIYVENASYNAINNINVYNNNRGIFVTGNSNYNIFNNLYLYYNGYSYQGWVKKTNLFVKSGLNNTYYGWLYITSKDDKYYITTEIDHVLGQDNYYYTVEVDDYKGWRKFKREAKYYLYKCKIDTGVILTGGITYNDTYCNNSGGMFWSGISDFQIIDTGYSLLISTGGSNQYGWGSGQEIKQNEGYNAIQYMTNPIRSNGTLYGWCDNANTWGPVGGYEDYYSRGKVYKYSYGYMMTKQINPVIYSGNDRAIGGKVDTGYYIGSNVPQITGSMSRATITKVEYVITGSSIYTGLVDTFELLRGTIPNWGHTGLQYRSGWHDDVYGTKQLEKTQLTGEINTQITMYVNTGTTGTITYCYVPQYYGENYFATHYGVQSFDVESPSIAFNPNTTSYVWDKNKQSYSAGYITKRTKYDSYYCISTGILPMNGIRSKYYDYMTGFDQTDLSGKYCTVGFPTSRNSGNSPSNSSCIDIPNNNLISDFDGPLLGDIISITGNRWDWVLYLDENKWLKLYIDAGVAVDAVEVKNVGNSINYYYDTKGPNISQVVINDGNTLYECQSTQINIYAEDACYIEEYELSGFVSLTGSWGNYLAPYASITINSGYIGRTGNIPKNLTGYVWDWLGYETKTGITIEIKNSIPQLNSGSVSTGYVDDWSGDMISVFGANEGECGTGDLSVTGLVCDGLTGTLEGNILKNISFTDENNTATGSCDMRVIDNEYISDSDSFATGRITFSRNYVSITGDFTGGLGTLECTGQNIFVVTGIFSEVVTGVVLSGENVEISTGLCIGESNSAGCTGYTWTVTLLGWTGRVWVLTGNISSSVGYYSGSENEVMELGNYAGNVGQVNLVSPGSGTALTGGNRTVDLEWSGLQKQGCAEISGYLVWLCTGTINDSTGCEAPAWTGWTSNTGWSKSGLNDGIYYRKVQGQNEFGKTGERSEVWMFEVDNSGPTLTGSDEWGLTGGFGDVCTTGNIFTVTGTFSEAVTGVELTGVNVTGLRMVVGGPGSGTYVWTGKLTGGTGRVWVLTGNITDMNGNPYTGARPELVVGNYDTGNVGQVNLVSPGSGTALTGGNRTGNLVWSGLQKQGCAEISGYLVWLCTGTTTINTGCEEPAWTGWTSNTGWSKSGLNDGIYYRKVQGQNEFGKTGERSEVWMFEVDNSGPILTGLDEWGLTGGFGDVCTTGNIFTVTGTFSEAVAGVELTGENVTGLRMVVGGPGSGTYVWTGELTGGGTGKVWVLTGNITDMNGNPYTGENPILIVGNYDAENVGKVSLVSPTSGKVWTGGNRTGVLNWIYNYSGCVGLSGVTVQLCTGTNTGCTRPGWTGWTSGGPNGYVGGLVTPVLEDGIYYRKVQQQNKNGKTGERSEVRMFRVDNTNPTGTGQTGGTWLGLTGGFGDACTSESVFTVTGTFSETVTGVELTGVNVTGLSLVAGSQGSDIYVWTGKLTGGGTGRVWIETGNITDMYGNPYTGARPELVVGNYDNVGPNNPTNLQPNGTIYQTGTSLTWSEVVDSGCAGLSGYRWNLYTGICGGDKSSGGFISAGDDLNYPSFNNLVNNQTYCREVISIDNYGHTGSASGSFTVSADNIGCEITAADPNSCTSGNVTLTLTGQSSRSGIYFSWIGGDFLENNWSGNSLTTGYSLGDGTVTGYIYQSGSNKSGTCIYTGINVDKSAPTITQVNIATGYECQTITGSITMTDAGCGNEPDTFKYQWNGLGLASNKKYATGFYTSGTSIINVTGYDKVGNSVTTGVRFIWYNSQVTANDFTGHANVGNSGKTVNWKIGSDAKDGACGSGTVYFSGFINTGTHGTCTVSGNNITYTPNTGEAYEGGDTCEIQIKDDEGTTGSITITFTGIDTKKPICELTVKDSNVCTGDSGLVYFDFTGSGYSEYMFVTNEWYPGPAVYSQRRQRTGTYTVYLRDEAGNTGSCSVDVTTGNIDTDYPTIQTGSWIGYECETGHVTVTGHDASCGSGGLTYSWSGRNFTGKTYNIRTGGTGTEIIIVSVIDGVGHETTSSVKYVWQNTGITLDESQKSLGEISTETQIQTGMIDRFRAREGNCGTGDITVSTGNCTGATWGTSGNKLTIIPNDGQDGSAGECEVIFKDNEGITATGKVTFGANTWQWSCVPGWDNNNFLDENFWTGLSQDLSTSKTEIICALYGTGEEDKTAYTKGWSGWDYSQCSGQYMNVVFTGTLRNNLDENTIYVLNTGKVVLNSGVNMAKCSAIISRSGSTITSSTKISSGFVYPKTYSILDNLSVEGKDHTGAGLHMYNKTGDNIVRNNTINHVATYGLRRGLLIERSTNNIINNFISYDNEQEGIRIYAGSQNALNNIVSFNNNSYGILIFKDATNILLNNVLVYNNSSDGIKISNNAGPIHMNNIVSFNNSGGLNYTSNRDSYFYGYLKIFGNLDDGKNDSVTASNTGNWSSGVYSTGGEVSFDMMVNPVNKTGHYLLDWSKTGGNLVGTKVITGVVGYSYGSGVPTQVQPVAWSGNKIIEVGNAKTGNYIGSNVKKVTGDLELSGSTENKNITVTGKSIDELVSYYSIFGDVNSHVIGQANGVSTGVTLSAGEGQKRLVAQLYSDKMFATHFEKSIMLFSQITLEEFTGGLGTDQCTHTGTFTVTGIFSKAVTGVVLSGVNVEIGYPSCIGEYNSAGCTGYTWTVTLVSGVAQVWIVTGDIKGISGGTYASSGISDTITLGNYDNGDVGQVTLVSPGSGTALTGGNRTGNLVWSGLQKQGCADISGYLVWLCTGTTTINTGCTTPTWTGWTSNTGWSKSGLNDGIYYRKVQGQNEFGKTGAWSNVRMFKVDNTYPTGTGQTGGTWLGLTGGFGDVCTTGNSFTVTGIFSEAVTGVVLSGENVRIGKPSCIDGNKPAGCTGYVWTGRLIGGGTGKVWVLTGNIRDKNGNPYSGARPELVVGNYDNVGPNDVTFSSRQNTIFTTNTTLSWDGTTDSGCADISGYNYKFVNGDSCEGSVITSGFNSTTSLSVTNLSHGDSYTLCVQPVDNFGNRGNWTNKTFTVNLQGIGCVIEESACSRTEVTLTLKPGDGVSGGTILLSWTGYTNMITGNSLVRLATQPGLLVTGYIRQIIDGTLKEAICTGVVANIDQIKPTITQVNRATGYECETITGSITMTDEGCGSGETYLYQWTGGAKIPNNQYATGLNTSGTRTIYVTGYDGVDNATSTGVQFIWYNSDITGHNFTGHTNVGSGARTVNWKTGSEATDGACGSGTVSFSGFVTDGQHGTCTTGEGNTIIYTPNKSVPYEGSDSCTIQIRDDEGSTENITIYWEGVDTEKPTCLINYDPQVCTSGAVTLSMSATGATRYSWTGWSNNNMTGNSGIQRSVSVNKIYTGYVKDAAGNTGWCPGVVNNISTGVLGAPTNLQPGSGAHKNGNGLDFSWSGVTDNGCRSVSGYKIFILSGEDTVVVSGVVNSGTSSWSLNKLANGTYEWYVETQDTLGGTNPSPKNILYVDSSGVVCTIESSSGDCRSSGNITLTLHVNKELSTVLTGWTHTTGSLTGTMEISGNTGINFTVYDLAGNSGQCSHNVTNFDFDSPTITEINIATGYECEIITGSITMTDDGCGSGTYLYQWTGGAKIPNNQYATGNTASGSIIIYVTGYDGVNNATSTGVQFIWYDSEVSANDFTGSTNVGNSAQTVNWKTGSEATDGACGSGTVSFSGFVDSGTNGTCTVSGDEIIYTPNTGQEYQGGDNCVIELTDDEGTTTITITITFTGIDTTAPECGTWTYSPGLNICTTSNVTATLTGSTDTGGIQTGGGSCVITGNNNTCNVTISDVAGNTTVCTSSGATNIDRTAPNVTVTNVTGYECTRITGSVSATDPINCGSLKYSWAGGDYENITGYGLVQTGVGSQSVTVKVRDEALNITTGTVTYTWLDQELRINSGYTVPGLLTGSRTIVGLTGSDIFNTTGYGSCETVSASLVSCQNASGTLNQNTLSITPDSDIEGTTGVCTITFTDGDTTKTGTIEFAIDTKGPTGTGNGLGLTGGLGTGQCTHTGTFTVTGTFSEAVTGVVLTGENVNIISTPLQGQSKYVWTVVLSGGIGRVRITGDIKDIYGNSLSGSIDELVLGDYDNVGPDQVTLVYPYHILPTTDTTLVWNAVQDSGCAGDVTYSYVITGDNYKKTGSGLTGTTADLSGFVNGKEYCRNVTATDKYGNNSIVSETFCFTVNTDGIQCNIVADRTTCGSGPILLTLAGVGAGDNLGEWLSRSTVGNTGDMTETGSLTKTITGFVTTTGYVQNKWGQTGHCEFTLEDVEEILDLEGSEITGVNYRSGYECETGTIQMNVSEDGCGLSGLKYQWNGVDGLTGNTIYGEKAQVITGIFSAINGAGVTTNTGYKFEWLDSPVTATGFTVDLMGGNTYNWKELAQASDGACGSATLTATASGGTKGTCIIEGGNIRYQSFFEATGSDSCILTISDDDGGPSVSVVVNFDHVSSYVELISPGDNREVEQGNVSFTWIPKDVPLTNTIVGYIYQVGNMSGFVDTTGVTLNLPVGTYNWSVTIKYTDGKMGGHSDLWSVKVVENDGGGGLVKDYCPNGDNTDSYYDGLCDIYDPHNVADECNVIYSPYTDEQKGAYLYAYLRGITTQCPISKANLDGYLRRDEFAKMISVYAINVVGREPNYGKAGCNQFNDIYDDVPELQNYMKLACELELMGMHADGVTPKAAFDPYSIVTRAEFGTVFSRLLFGDMYNVKNEPEAYKQEGYWYKKHLQALKEYGVMTKVDGDRPKYLERRGRAMIMLERADNYGLFQGKSPAINGIKALFS